MARVIIDLLGRKFRVLTETWEISLKPNEGIPQGLVSLLYC